MMADTTIQVESYLEVLMFLLTGLGYIINVPKSVTTPTQQIEFLSLKVDSTSLQLSLMGEKLHHIRMKVSQHLQRSQVTAQQLAQLIGKLHGASQALLPAPLFYRSRQGDLQRYQPELQCDTVTVRQRCRGGRYLQKQISIIFWHIISITTNIAICLLNNS